MLSTPSKLKTIPFMMYVELPFAHMNGCRIRLLRNEDSVFKHSWAMTKATAYTENQIKSLDERLWAFAVEVE